MSGDYHSLSDYASSASARRSPDSPARYSTPPLIAASPRQSRDNVGSEATVAPVRRAPARYHTAGTGAMDPSRAIDGVVGQDSRAAHHPSVPDQATADPFDQPDGPPTPEGDNRPYIQYALDQITRNDARGSLPPFAADDDDDDYTVERVIPDEGLGYMAKEKEREKEREKEQERLKTVDAEAAAYTGAAAGAVVATTSPPLRTVHTKASTLRRTSSEFTHQCPYYYHSS